MVSRTVLKRGYFGALRAAGKGISLRRRIHREKWIVVLNLHRVSPDRNPFWSPLHPALFEDLVTYLTRRFRVATFGEVDRDATDEPRIVLSFDDGYYDFIEYALPILDKHGVMANQNVIPHCLDTGRPPWTVQLSDFLQSASPSLIRELRLPGFEYVLEGTDDDSKTRYGLALSRFLKQYCAAKRQNLWFVIEQLMERAGTIRWTRMINVTEARAISSVCELGVHSFSHESMGLESDAFFEQDFERCIRYFDQTLGLPLSIYAFPNGSHRPSQVQYLIARGAKNVLLVDEQFARRRSCVFPRVTLYGDSAAELQLRALGYAARGPGASSNSYVCCA